MLAIVKTCAEAMECAWQGHRFLRLGKRCRLVATVYARTATSRLLSKHQELRGVPALPKRWLCHTHSICSAQDDRVRKCGGVNLGKAPATACPPGTGSSRATPRIS